MIEVIGVDVGYSYVKVIADNACFMFPAVSGRARELNFGMDEIQAQHPNEQIVDGDGDWFIGDLALQQLDASSIYQLHQRTQSVELEHSFRRRMVLAALAKIFPDKVGGNEVIDIHISTGLPVQHIAADAASLKEALLGKYPVHTDGTHFIANIVQVNVIPQGLGALYSRLYNENGAIADGFDYDTASVLDVGSSTINLITDENGIFLNRLSASVDGGMGKAHEILATAVNQVLRLNPTRRQLEKLIKSGFLNNESFVDERENAIRVVADNALQLLNQKLGSGAEVEIIIVSGGGGAAVFDTVARAFPNIEVVISDTPQYDNCTGYLRYAKSLYL